MQVGSGRLGKGLVGGVANQEVAEAEGVLAGKLRLVGPDEVAADERGEARRHLTARPKSACTAPRWKVSPLDGTSLEHGALDGLELVEARGEKCPERRRDRTSPFASAAIATISITNSGFPPAARTICRRKSSGNASGSARRRPAPPTARAGARRATRAAIEELRPSQAEEQDRRPGREQGDVLDEVEERLLAPLDVVEDADERRLLLEQLAEGPGDLLGRRRPRRLPSRERSAAAASGSGGRPSSCFSTSTTGQYVIPSPYGRQRPRTIRASTAPSELRDEAGLADAGLADHGDQPAALLPPAHCQVVRSSRELALAPDQRRLVAARGASARPRTSRNAANRLGLALQLERLDRFGFDRVAHERRGRFADQDLARRAACSRRAATLTASPVASRSSVPVTTSPVLTPIRA